MSANDRRRFSATQALSIIHKIADDESGDEDDNENSDNYSDSDEHDTSGNESDDDSEAGAVNDDVPEQVDALTASQNAQEPEDMSISDYHAELNRGRGRGRDFGGGRGIGRGRGGSGNSRGRGLRGNGRGGSGANAGECAHNLAQPVRPALPDEEIARDGTVWKRMAFGEELPGRLSQQNILKELPGPTPYAKRNIEDESATSAFKLLIDEPLLRHIQRSTVAEARLQLDDNTWNMSLAELDAFVAILYARGALGAKGTSVKDMWDTTWGAAFFRETMPRNRFLEIMKYLRFDLRTTRSVRLQADKFALASEPWNRFIANSILCYKPGENITIDEQLFPTKARCKWTQYIASKPDKYGIKFWLAADVKSKYLVNGFPYLGEDEQRPQGVRLADHVVMRLMEPYLGKGRNVTTDNYFTSLKLCNELTSKKTSIVGTVNKIRREVPASANDVSSPMFSTNLLTHQGITMTTYRCKRNKNVVLFSTLHRSVSIDGTEKKKPETIQFYNATKFGVDVVDQMARKYSVKASSRRWPVQVFYNVLDLAAINAWVLYKETTNKRISRRKFILQLCNELRQAYIATPPRALVAGTGQPAEVDGNDVGVEPQPPKRRRRHCQVATCKGNKGCEICSMCKKVVCGTCTLKKRIVTEIRCVTCGDNQSHPAPATE